MCIELIHGVDCVETMGELEQLVPRDQWIYGELFEKASYYKEGCCLCPLDVASTLRQAGYRMRQIERRAYIIEKGE